MSYFDLKIYNKQNLMEKDRKALDFWNDFFLGIISNAEDFMETETGTGIESIDKIIADTTHSVCEKMKVLLGTSLQEVVVSIIDEYEDGVPRQENFETYLYGEEE